PFWQLKDVIGGTLRQAAGKTGCVTKLFQIPARGLDHPHIPPRRPHSGIRRTEQCDYRHTRRSGQVSDAGIIPDIETRACKPLWELPKIVEPRRIRQLFLRTGDPADRSLESAG